MAAPCEPEIRIFRLLITSSSDEGTEYQAITASGFVPDMLDAFPEIEHAVRTFEAQPYLRPDFQAFPADEFLFVDDGFFEAFTFELPA